MALEGFLDSEYLFSVGIKIISLGLHYRRHFETCAKCADKVHVPLPRLTTQLSHWSATV